MPSHNSTRMRLNHKLVRNLDTKAGNHISNKCDDSSDHSSVAAPPPRASLERLFSDLSRGLMWLVRDQRYSSSISIADSQSMLLWIYLGFGTAHLSL